MKKCILFGTIMLAAGGLWAAESNPKDEVTTAATALGASANYTWHQTVEVPDGGFGSGTTDGKTEKGGYTALTFAFGDNTSEAVTKGTNAAIKTADSGWQSAAEALANNEGGGFNPTAFLALMAQNNQNPDKQAAELAGAAKALKAGDKGITGDLTEAGVKDLLTFRRSNFPAPKISNAKGSVTFWLADGKLTKYQFHVTGSMSFNDNDFDVDRTTTVEIKDVGTTKVKVPDEAKKKLE